MHKIAVNH